MDDEDKFKENQIPSAEMFYSQLTEQHISESDYNHARHVWDYFNTQNLGDYHDLYLITDVLLLADVFEQYRDVCIKHYKLDPAHYYTAPGLFCQAMLKMTDVELELLIDIDQHLFVESSIQGGISMISNRFSRANNSYLQDYDVSRKSSYILPLDANNLYGWAMVQPLQSHGFQWLTEEQIADFDVMKVKDESETGYILDVYLEYSQALHATHSDYPLAPKSLIPTEEMLSPYSLELLQHLGMKPGKVAKLIPNLGRKENVDFAL